MDIVIGRIPSVRKEPPDRRRGSPDHGRLSFKDRRKNKLDRRKDVRSGVVLSFSGDKRVTPDRRRAHAHI